MIATNTTNKVQFDMESCDIHDIEHLNDCTEEQVADRWITKKEWKEIRKEYKEVLELLQTKKNETKTATTAASLRRGLERFIPEMANDKNQRIRDSIHAVLMEQNRQCTDGNVQDDTTLADVYRKSSSTSIEMAFTLAQDDEHVANRIYYKESKIQRGNNSTHNVFFKSRKVQRRPSMLTQIRQVAKSIAAPPRR